MSGVFEKLGVRFMYPENWEVADEDLTDEPKTVSVISPSGAFWSLHVYESERDLQQLAEEVVENLRQEYQDLEAYPVTETFGETESLGYDLNFICLDFVIAGQLRCGTHEGRSFVVLCQAEDEEFGQLEKVFQAITYSWANAQSIAE